MKYYHIPLCTRDFTFENIFSTESISPYDFYAKRNFGIDYFYKLDEYELNDAIVLYNDIPKFSVDSIQGAIKFILAIDIEEIEKEDMIIIAEGIVGLQTTIYLTKKNFNILFFSERDMKLVIAKSASSLPTKSVVKYSDNFKIIEETAGKSFDTKSLESTKITVNEIEREISFDRKFNSVKGFFYGLVCGLVSEKTPEEVKLKRGVQEIVNAAAEFRSRTESRISDSRFAKAGLSSVNLRQKVYEKICEVEKDFVSQFPQKEISLEYLSQILLTKFKNLLDDIDDAKKYLNRALLNDHFFGSKSYNTIKKSLLENSENEYPELLFERLKELYFLPLSSKEKSSSTDDQASLFKNIIFKINNFIDSQFSSKIEKRTIQLEGIQYNSESTKIEIEKEFQFLKNDLDINEFSLISNVILKNAKHQKGDASKEVLLQMIEDVGNGFNTTKAVKESTLYQYLNNEIDAYALEKVTSFVMKNFVAFIFNPDSLEKLEKFLDAKSINYKWIAYSFWCAFNGFANTSRNFLDPLFNVQNYELQDYLDEYCINLRKIIGKNGLSSKLEITASEEVAIQPKDDLDSKIKIFFEKYIKGNFEILLEDFIHAIGKDSNDEATKYLKDYSKLEKKEIKKILDSFQEFIKSPALF